MLRGAAPCGFQGAGFDFSSWNWGQQRSGSEVKKQKARFEIRSGLFTELGSRNTGHVNQLAAAAGSSFLAFSFFSFFFSS